MQAFINPLPALPSSCTRSLIRKVLAGVWLLELICSGCFAQVRGIITDKNTGAPVAFANIQVEGGTKGATAAADGTFAFDEAVSEDAFLIVSSIGYERRRVKAAAGTLEIKLAPQAQTLAEVTVRKPGKAQKRTISTFKKSALRSGFGIGSQNTSPWIIARYFPYQPEYAQTPYFEALTLVTRSNIPDARFRLRLLQATADGTPGTDILHTPLIVQAPKGNKAITVNLNEYNVVVPPEGFFVAFEWLLLPENRNYYTYTSKNGTKKTAFSYEPALAASLVKRNTHTWIYAGGAWTRNYARHSDNTYSEPQYKIVLSR